jgi:hypothetical protein
MIAYDKYTELLSKMIHKTASEREKEQVSEFEQAQPKTCPKCHSQIWSPFNPPRIVHDITGCHLKQNREV